MNRPAGNRDGASRNHDEKRRDPRKDLDWIPGLVWFLLGIGTAVYVWIFTSFIIPVIDSRVPGWWWRFPQPAGHTNWGEIAVAGITFLFFLAALLQWGVTRTTARLTMRSLELNISTQRAWLFVENIGPLDFTEGQNPVIRISVRNVGILPALDTHTELTVALSLTHALALLGNGVPGVTLPIDARAMFGRDQVHRMESAIDMPMLDWLRPDLVQGTWTVRLRVDIGYTDPLGTQGTTTMVADYIHRSRHWAWRSGSVT